MSFYRFVTEPSGFRVERTCVDRLTVQLEPWALSVRYGSDVAARCSFFEGDRLALLITTRLLGEDDTAVDLAAPPLPLPRAVREARSIKTDVGLQRIRLLAQVDPAVLRVQLIARRLVGRVPSLAQEAALYREPYILRDILAYRAAAIAFAYLQSDLWRPPATAQPGSGRELVGQEPDADAATPSAEDGSSDTATTVSEPAVVDLLNSMAQWRGLFSPDGKPYRSLDRTLMNLPQDVSPELVCCLSRIRLERPMLHWLELTTLLLYTSSVDAACSPAESIRFRMFHHASATDIARAVVRIGEETNRALHPRRPEDLRFAVKYLCDYPDAFHGPVAGLVERVIRWHRQAHEHHRVERQAIRLGGYDQPVVQPRIPLPSLPGVTFLGSVGAIAEEGERMGHCIATRSEDALRGRCYLFHIDHQNERASVEVSVEGKIVDAQGPHNTDNTAACWGAMQLRSWAAGLVSRKILDSRNRAQRRRRAAASDPNQLRLPF